MTIHSTETVKKKNEQTNENERLRKQERTTSGNSQDGPRTIHLTRPVHSSHTGIFGPIRSLRELVPMSYRSTSSLSSIRTDSPPSSSSNSNSSLLMDSRVLNSVTNQPANDTSSLIDLISKLPSILNRSTQYQSITETNHLLRGTQTSWTIPSHPTISCQKHSVPLLHHLERTLISCSIHRSLLISIGPLPHRPQNITKSFRQLSPVIHQVRRLKTDPKPPVSWYQYHSNSFVDLLGLLDHHSPRPPISRSKSTTAIQPREKLEPLFLSDDTQHDQQQPKFATKSILKRPNSPSKGARARFFSPRVLSGEHTEESDENDSSWVDEHGNCRGREIIHEFQKDEPPMTRLKPTSHPPHPCHPLLLLARSDCQHRLHLALVDTITPQVHHP
ncbi:hypothetical protein H4Q26_002690 [Puccinia striiformis f. sp. tritici PST-130]|nr:hypothetical protein H4Q26_002690 [Puccinia striiformis f. sp. tritici PST-130]